MKILYHHRTRAEDAQGIHINEIINAFRALDHNVEVAGIISHDKNSQGNSSSLISRIAENVPSLVYEIMEITYNLYGFYNLRKKIVRFKPDFIYERYALFNFAGVLVSKLYGIPLIEEVNAPLSYEKAKYSKLILKRFAAWCEKMICSCSRKTIVVSGPLKKMIQSFGVPEEKLIIIPNGVNQAYFNTDIDGSKIRKKYNLKNKKVLGFVGWFRKWHGLEELLEIFSEKKIFEHNIHLMLVGDGPAYDSLISIAEKNNILNSFVTFTGPVPRKDVPEYISAFDLALQPDVTDYASPIKLFEYISMGKGVIAPDKENIKEILTDRYPGLFKAGDWQDMGSIIIESTESNEKIKSLGQETYSIFLTNKYLWLENARKTIELIN